MTGENPDPIAVTSRGGTLWLECFAENAGTGPGRPVIELRPGTTWGELAWWVQQHQEQYKCAEPEATPAVTTDGGEPE
jgi:hypothetical protein